MNPEDEHSEEELEEPTGTTEDTEDFDPSVPASWETPEQPTPELDTEGPTGTDMAGQAGDEDSAQTQPALSDASPTKAEQLPEQPPDEHPDNLAWLDLPPAERVKRVQELAETNPELLIRSAMRQNKFTKEMTKLARQREIQEAQQALAPPAAPAAEEPEVPTGLGKWAEQFRETTGREPTQGDYIEYQVQQQVAQVVEPMQTAQIRREAKQTNNQLGVEYEELVAKYPEASSPEVKEAIGNELMHLAEAGMDLKPGVVKRVYFGLYGEAREEAAKQGTSQARQQQVASRQAAPALPPATGGGRTAAPYTSNIDAVAERLKRDPRFQE